MGINNEKDSKKVKAAHARAEALTPEQRKDIARKAALSRWDVGVPQVEFEGPFNIGDNILFGAVLPNGKRVITQATFLRTLGRSRSPGWYRCFKHCRRNPIFFTG